MQNFPQARKRRNPEASLEDAPVACHEINLEGTVVWVNAAECRMLGLNEADLLARPVWETVAPEEQDASRRALNLKFSIEGRLDSYERTVMRADGTRMMMEVHEGYMRDEAGTIVGIRAFLIDITERKRAEEELHKIQEDLELRIAERTQELELAIEFLRREMDKGGLPDDEHRKREQHVQLTQHVESIGVLAGGMAHEFNNLLTSIMGYASLAAMDLTEDAPARKNIGHVLDAAQSAADLTQQMLAYSGRGRFGLEALDASKLVEGMARLLQSTMRQECTLQFSLAPDLPVIEADPRQVRQVVMNLFTNANEALDKRGGTIVISTGLMWAEGGELPPLQAGRILSAGLYVFIEVRDTGSGMAPGTLAKVFEPFFTTKVTGRGLGLAAAQGIMRGHRGSIQAASELGVGSVFRVLFRARDEWDEREDPLVIANW